MKISMLKKALTFKLLKTLVSVKEAFIYKTFCIQLQRLNDCLIKLKSIQTGSSRRYTSTVNTSTRVSAARPGFQVSRLTAEEAADQQRREVCINCKCTDYIAVNCCSDHVSLHEKRVRVNRAAVEKDLNDDNEDVLAEVSRQKKD
ncbi:hypothetical protein AJ78_08712 [Emergomyces pasteurianus Ep9510]|uniref:Uncharacterized protein n=1 Tax=Emergomyces pasteurianus Ep9510 TaxID=1447872 RepID=A0A1J9P027_9EURO|nr:hypothetical protein AJ78_08712 [Emergomyces pasteurianus Ep9510]